MLQKVKSFLFENRTVRQTVAKNTFWLTASNISGRLLRAVIIIYAARVLGAAEWGVFSYAITLVAFLIVFVDLGINSILMRETAKAGDFSLRSRILSTSFLMKLALLALGVAGVIFLAPHFTAIEKAKALFPIVSLILIFDTLREFGFSLSRALEKMEWEAGLYFVTNVAIVAFGFLFLCFRPTVESFTYSYAVGTGVGMAATFFVLRKYLRGLFSGFSSKLMKIILTSAWPFAISGLLGALMINTDILIIGWLRSAEDVGLYSAAQRIVQLLYVLPAIAAISVLPTFSRLVSRDDGRLRRILERVISFAFLIAIPVAVGGVMLGQDIIAFVFGSGYLSAAASFQILILTVMIDFPAIILSNAIFAYDRQKNLIIYAAIGGGLNVVLDLLLIPQFGIVGSAWATLVAQLISNIYLWRVLKKINYFRILPFLKKIVLATACMTVVSLFFLAIRMNVALNIGISALLYFGILYRLREPLFEEIKLVLAPENQKAAVP